MFDNLLADLAAASSLILTWEAILAIALGIVVGHWVGAIPGLTSSMAIALLIPVTFYVPAWVAISMLIGVYKGALFADSTAAILIKTPGMPAAAATMLDGYPLSQQGKAGKALRVALVSSVVGDAFSDIVLILFAGMLAALALRFGPPEYTAMMFFALTILAGVAGSSLLKGIAAALVGLLLATVGSDPMTSSPRFTFGAVSMIDGLSLVPLLIGLLALSEVLTQLEKRRQDHPRPLTQTNTLNPDDQRMTRADFKQCAPAMMRGAAIGTILGAIPGIGATVAAFLSYTDAKRRSSDPSRFGNGAIEGVAAADSATSAISGANMIPLLVFGIPGDVVAAILLGAFMIHGITPGPLVFQENLEVIYAIYMGLMIATFFNFVLGLIFIRFAMLVLRVPRNYLFPTIISLTVIGSYAINGSFFDVQVMFVFGIVGFLMNKFGYSPIALLIGFILGPMLETNLRRSLILSGDDFWIFLTRPISLLIIVLTFFVLWRLLRLRRKQQVAASD